MPQRSLVNGTGARPSLEVRVPAGRLRLEELIGRGSFATVYRAHHVDWGSEVAYKKLKVELSDQTQAENDKILKRMRKEASIHMSLRHASVVLMYGSVAEEDNYGFVLEYVKYRSFHNFVSIIKAVNGTGFLPLLVKAKMAHDVASGMSYLHSLAPHPIIHSDLKLQNILVADHFNAKISDFGLSKWKEYSISCSSASMFVGTASHIPPEKWLNYDLDADEKFDVYGFAIMLWELLAGGKPFGNCRSDMLPSRVTGGERPPLELLPPDTPSLIRSVLTACWRTDASQRPAFPEVVGEFEKVISGLSAEAEIQKAKIALHNLLQKTSTRKSDDAAESLPHTRDINRVRVKLVESIRRTDRIVAALYQDTFLSPADQERINSQLTMTDRAEQLLDAVCACTHEGYQCFLRALRDTKQGHLCDLLTIPDYEWDPKHRQALIKHYTFLVDQIQLEGSSILDHLRQYEVLDEHEVEEILSVSVGYKKNQKLLNLISRTTAEQYARFLEALETSKHEHVYEVLLDPKQPKHVRDIQRVHAKVVESMRRTDKIVAALYEDNFLTDTEQKLIRTQVTLSDKAEHLLSVIVEKPADAYKCFLEALSKTEQGHIMDLLTKTDYAWDPKHRQTLMEHQSYLMSRLQVEGTQLLKHLLLHDVLSEEELREIKAVTGGRGEQNSRLVALIRRTTDRQYEKFLEALRDSNQESVCQHLQGKHETLYKRLQSEVSVYHPDSGIRSLPDQLTPVSVNSSVHPPVGRALTRYFSEPGGVTKHLSVAAAALPDFPSHAFPLETSIIDIIDGSIMAIGVASLGHELFLVRFTHSTVDVFDSTTFKQKRQIYVPGLEYPWCLSACQRYNCLYICDNTTSCLHRVDRSKDSFSKWSLNGMPSGVTVTRECNVLVTLCDTRRIQEYTTRGTLLREIGLDASLENPGSAIKLSNGQFVISHAGSMQHRVCVVDTAGRILKSYDGPPASSTGQIYWPCNLAVDRNSCVLVADYHNNKIRLLSPAMTLLGDVTAPRHQLSAPSGLCLDQPNGRLYVCEVGGQVVITSCVSALATRDRLKL